MVKTHAAFGQGRRHFDPLAVSQRDQFSLLLGEVLAEEIAARQQSPLMRAAHKVHRPVRWADLAQGDPSRKQLAALFPSPPVVAVLMPSHVDIADPRRLVQQLHPPDLHPLGSTDFSGQRPEGRVFDQIHNRPIGDLGLFNFAQPLRVVTRLPSRGPGRHPGIVLAPPHRIHALNGAIDDSYGP